MGIFPNETAIRRLVRALLLERNDGYVIRKRDMRLVPMAGVSENPTNSLPAAAAVA